MFLQPEMQWNAFRDLLMTQDNSLRKVWGKTFFPPEMQWNAFRETAT